MPDVKPKDVPCCPRCGESLPEGTLPPDHDPSKGAWVCMKCLTRRVAELRAAREEGGQLP